MKQSNNITDMTTGSTLMHLLRFSFPLLIGNLFQQLYNMVDSLVVGNYVGANALAAVGACGSMNFLFFSLSSGLAIGIGIIVSQYFGAGNDSRVKETIANSIYILIFSSLFGTILGVFISPAVLKLLNTPDVILNSAVVYMRTTCCGIIGISFYNGVSSILRALGDSKTPLYFLIFSSIANVLLDLLFVLVFHWGVFGVAFATIIAQALSAIISMFYAYQKVAYFKLKASDLIPDWPLIYQSFRLGVPVALQGSMIAVSIMVLQGVVNSFGETVIAAYTISSRIEQIVYQPYTSLSTAITNFSGQNIGAGKIDRVKKGFHVSILIVLVFSLLLIPVAYLFGSSIVGLFVKETDVIIIGAKGLRITSLCYFALGMIYVPRAILNGCGDTGFSMINGITEVTCRIVYSNVFTRIPKLGYWGIWITMGATWITTAIICIIRYLSGKWKEKTVAH